MGKVAPALVDRGRGGRSSQMAGNGTYAASRMEIDYVPIRSPVSGANWRRTNYMRTSKRAWGGSSPPRTGVAPRFQAERGETGGCDGRRGGSAKEGGPGRGTRSAHMFGSQPEFGLFRPSDWHMVRFSPARPDRGRDGRSRGPIALARTPLGGRTPGSNPAWWQDPRLAHALMEGPWLEPRLLDSRSGEIGGIWQPPRLMD